MTNDERDWSYAKEHGITPEECEILMSAGAGSIDDMLREALSAAIWLHRWEDPTHPTPYPEDSFQKIEAWPPEVSRLAFRIVKRQR